MGSGASKAAAPSGGDASKTGTAVRAVKAQSTAKGTGLQHQPKDEFDAACLQVFRNADRDKSGTLNRKEFWSVLKSKTLNLNLSTEEMEDMQRMVDQDASGNVSYENFVPVVRKLLQRVYQKKATDWNDWCKVRPRRAGRRVV